MIIETTMPAEMRRASKIARFPACRFCHEAAEWLTRLLQPEVLRLEGALFALAQLARLTGDRTRDLDEPARAQVLSALEQQDASPSWRRMVCEVVALEAKDKARALGDTLPAGLVLP